MIGAELLMECLRAAGVTFVTTIVGNGINPVLQAAREQGVRVIDTRNEQAASYMAEAYAKFTRRIGVCAVSASVGHTNALTGLLNARLDGAPLLLISGSADHRYTDRGKFQDFDQVATAAPICKYARLVDHPEKIAFYLREALTHATSGRPGPVHLTIPQDVLEAEVPDETLDLRSFATVGMVRPDSPAPAESIAQAAETIALAERPLLVAGSGVFYSGGAEALAHFADVAQMPVVVPIWDRGGVQAATPEFMGVIGAVSGSPDLLQDADLVVLVGARVDYRLGYLEVPAVRPDLRVLRIDVDPLELHQGMAPHLAVQGDPRSVLEQIGSRLEGMEMAAHGPWLEEAHRRDAEFRRRWQPGVYEAERMTGWHIVQALRPFLKGGAVLVMDGGNIGQWMHMVGCDRYPGDWMTCGAGGVVGYGLGGAMAGRLAHPDRPVILLSGDGSIGFNLADIETAVRHRLPFVIVLADDQSWGVTASSQSRQYGEENVVGCALGPVRYDRAAEALGANGVRVESAGEIGPAIQRALASERVTLIQVPIAQGGPSD